MKQWFKKNIFSFKYKKNLRRRSGVFILVLVALGGIFFVLLKNSQKRNLAQISSAELKYAEILLDEETTSDEELILAPSWEDPLSTTKMPENTLDNQLEYRLEEEYQNNLIEKYNQRKEMKRKADYAKEILRRAREDGFDLTIDKDLNVIEVKRLPEKSKSLYKY